MVLCCLFHPSPRIPCCHAVKRTLESKIPPCDSSVDIVPTKKHNAVQIAGHESYKSLFEVILIVCWRISASWQWRRSGGIHPGSLTYCRYQKWPYLEGATLSKPSFWVSMLLLGGVTSSKAMSRPVSGPFPPPTISRAPGSWLERELEKPKSIFSGLSSFCLKKIQAVLFYWLLIVGAFKSYLLINLEHAIGHQN